MELFHQKGYTCFRCQPYSMRTVTVYYCGHQYPSRTGSGVKSYHLQMRTVKDVNTSVKLSLSRAQCLSTEHAYIALPQRLSICEQKLLFHLTFFISAELSTWHLVFSFYTSRKFYGLLDPASTNIAPSPQKRAHEFVTGMLSWDIEPCPEASVVLFSCEMVGKTLPQVPARLDSKISVISQGCCAISLNNPEEREHFLQDERFNF